MKKLESVFVAMLAFACASGGLAQVSFTPPERGTQPTLMIKVTCDGGRGLACPIGSTVTFTLSDVNGNPVAGHDIKWMFGDDAVIIGESTASHAYSSAGPKTVYARSAQVSLYITETPAEQVDATITPDVRVAPGNLVLLHVVLSKRTAAALTVSLQSSSPDVVQIPPSVTIAAGASSTDFQGTALRAGFSRVTGAAPGMTVGSAAVDVIEPAALVVDRNAVTVQAGSDATVLLSVQPALTTPLQVTFWSRPEVATVPDSVTIPPGGSAVITIHGVASGYTVVGITSIYGSPFVGVTVSDAPARRRSARR